MNPKNELSVPKWPFFLADGLFVAAAGALWFSAAPPGPGIGAIVAVLLILAGLLAMAPYLIEVCWNWQFAMCDEDERSGFQRQILERTEQQIVQAAERWEEIRRQSSGAAGEFKSELDELFVKLRQAQANSQKQEEKLAARLAEWMRIEHEAREATHQRIERLTGLVEALSVEPVNSPDPSEVPGEGNANSRQHETPESEIVTTIEPEQASGSGPENIEETEAPESSFQSIAEEPVPPARSRKPKKPQVREAEKGSLFSTTTIVATAYIGAGNKLYLRGEGPGLSWDQGVPMRFVEIGKWSWTTTDATGPIRLKLFKNDEEEDKTGVLTLQPGQRLDVRPDFDG